MQMQSCRKCCVMAPIRLEPDFISQKSCTGFIRIGNTDKLIYTDTRYSDKIRSNDNLTVMKASLKR